ncbi:L,D-transpeptidase [Baekduia sp.]|jgi:hypothetical protein|uniref:L,D-transpeptidase n=1 Tax=Baekduia sp. TaxID=2600305 RepID=UPI002E0662FB|nr:L,D-transpeptidase [Baekduia sp.]
MGERRRLPHTASGATIAGALAIALSTAPPTAATPARCTLAAAPSHASAWRAYVPPSTPVRARPASPAAHAPVTLAGSWLLVLATARGPGGECLLQVRLDRRPNTAHGWVAANRVRLVRTRWRIEISRARRRAVLRHAGRAVARWPVVVGAPATPTPRGLFALQASYRSPASSFEGTWILALTAHSQILATFDGGDGRVALHGRGPASLIDPLGSAASHGCIRFDNHAIATIVRRVGRGQLPGIPVAIS